MEPFNHASVLSTKGLNTLLFSDPYAKLRYTSLLASSPGKAAYIDLDTAFAAHLQAGLVRAGRVDVYLPSEGQFMAVVKEVLGRMQEYSLVILDSINSFYAMYYGYYESHEKGGGNLNHLLSAVIMLLVRHGVSAGIPVLATSMLRYRKEGGWKQSPASRRLLQQKSAARMSVERAGEEVVLRVLEHESVPAGTEFPVRA